MQTKTRDQFGRVAVASLGVLALAVLAVPSADARIKIRPSGGSRSVSRPPTPHAPTPKPAAPSASSPTASAPAPRAVSAPSVNITTTVNRGMFRRFWDWMLGRKPPTPQPAPAPAAGLAQAAAPANPAAAPTSVPAVVPIPVGGARPAAAATPAGQPTGPGQDQDKQRRMAGNQTQAAAGAAGAAAGVSLAAALEQSFGKPNGQAGPGRGQGGNRPGLAGGAADGRAGNPHGYILHLTNGRRMPVPYYQEKGDQVVIEQVNGHYSLPKSIVARIEPRTARTEVLSPGVNTR